jgi:uncharacterized protein (DUF305 family)
VRFEAALFLLAAAAPAGAQHEGHQHHQAPDAPVASDAQFTACDIAFLEHMSLHHQQAIDMAALVPGRDVHADFASFSRLVARTQAAEIAAMGRMVAMARERGTAEPATMDMSGDPPMAGMLSSAQMRALAQAEGALFQRLWLEGMIFHHEGGIAMAQAQQARQLTERRYPHGLADMVESIIEEQRAEIGMMRSWLGEWDLAAAQSAQQSPVGQAMSARRLDSHHC